MKIGWALDMIGWAFAQPFPTFATPLDLVQSGHFSLWNDDTMATYSSKEVRLLETIITYADMKLYVLHTTNFAQFCTLKIIMKNYNSLQL